MSRQQAYFGRAYQDVQSVKTNDHISCDAKQIYGGLCHTVPVLVRVNGLCQTVAYVEAKARGENDRARAYRELRGHLAGVIGAPGMPGSLADHVRTAEQADYVRATRAVLAAAVYYKRFAVSILNVETPVDTEDEG